MHRLRALTTRNLLLIAALVAVAALLASGCGGKSSSSSVSPETAIQDALTKTAGIDSGQAGVKAAISIGSLPGSFDINGGGPFDAKASGGGAFDLDFKVNIAGSSQEFGFTKVDGKSYVTAGDKALEQKGASAGIDPKSVSSFLSGIGKYLSNAKQTSDGTYTATVNVKQLLEDSKGSKNGLSGASIPGLGSVSQLSNEISTANITVKVDSQGYADYLDIDLPIKQGSGEGGVRATITLTDINQPVTITAPKNVVSDSSELGAIGGLLGN